MRNTENVHIAAADIGYSNLKVKHGVVKPDGQVDVKSSVVVPATAVKEEHYPYVSIPGLYNETAPFRVVVDGAPWFVGHRTIRLDTSPRHTHEDYAETVTYRAMFYALLSDLKTDTLDVLVTGLPVNQISDPKRVEFLERLFTGKHKVSENREIEVRKVAIVAQQSGAYFDFCANQKKQPLIENKKLLILDSGYYALNFMLVENGKPELNYSGTITKSGVLDILEEAVQNIKQDLNTEIEPSELEDAIQRDESTVFLKGRKVEYQKYIDMASARIANDALVSIKTKLRHIDKIDTTLLVGGGCHLYQKQAEVLLNNCKKFKVSSRPLLANLDGYWMHGIQLAQSLQKKS